MQAKTVVRAAVFSIAMAGLNLSPAQAQNRTLNAVFTPAPIQVDGKAEEAWSKAAPSDIAICMNSRRTRATQRLQGLRQRAGAVERPAALSAVHRHGPGSTRLRRPKPLDPACRFSSISTTTSFRNLKRMMATSRSALRASKREIVPNANLPYYPTVWSKHLQSYAAALRTGSDGGSIGYTVEIGWSIGDLPLKNGTKLGMEFAINADPSICSPGAAEPTKASMTIRCGVTSFLPVMTAQRPWS